MLNEMDKGTEIITLRANGTLKQNFMTKTKERCLDASKLIRMMMRKFTENPDDTLMFLLTK